MLRLKDSSGYIIDVVAWRERARLVLWQTGTRLEIFYGQVNRERTCIELNDESRIRMVTGPMLLPMSTEGHFVNWVPFKREK